MLLRTRILISFHFFYAKMIHIGWVFRQLFGILLPNFSFVVRVSVQAFIGYFLTIYFSITIYYSKSMIFGFLTTKNKKLTSYTQNILSTKEICSTNNWDHFGQSCNRTKYSFCCPYKKVQSQRSFLKRK